MDKGADALGYRGGGPKTNEIKPIGGIGGYSPMHTLLPEDIDRVIGMAWEDRTPFEAIEAQFGLKEPDVIELMRREMTRSSFEMWRKRVTGRKTKHSRLRGDEVERFRSDAQRSIALNKIPKRRNRP